MLRVIASVLAAFVGFSLGHSIPKWMESRQKSATGMQSPSLSEPVPRTRKQQSFRKIDLRKFKFSLQKPSKEDVEANGSLHKLCNVAEATSHEDVESNAHDRLRKEHKKLKFRAQRLAMDKSNHACLDQGLDSTGKMPLSAPQFDFLCPLSKKNGGHRQQAAPTDPKISKHGLSEVSSPQLNAVCVPPQEMQVSKALQNESNLVGKSPALQSPHGSPTKERSQMKQWKMKLMSLRSKAMASEKVWCEKFDNEGCGGELSVLSPTGSAMVILKTAKGKESESRRVIRNKKRDFFWSRSSSRVGLLVEGPKSIVES